MKLEYDPEADAAYVRLTDASVVESEEIKPGIILDYDAENRVVGVEILYVSRRRPDIDLDRPEVDTLKRG